MANAENSFSFSRSGDAGASGKRQIAAFDFDGTLTVRDSLVPFLRRVAGGAGLARACVAEVRALYRDMKGGQREEGKERVLQRVFRGESVAGVEELAVSFAEERRDLLRPQMFRRVEWHRAQEHELIIISASLHVYLEHVARVLGFDHVIAVELETENGLYTGHMRGPNVRAQEKANRLLAWLDGAEAEIWAYGDSRGDKELLELADHALFVGSARRHEKIGFATANVQQVGKHDL